MSTLPVVIEHTIFGRELSRIDENLYISGTYFVYNISLDLKTAQNSDILRREGINYVVNLIAHRSDSMKEEGSTHLKGTNQAS